MKITPLVHCLRIDFQVTPEILRFVNVFFLIGEKITLIDAGVAGSGSLIADYLAAQGRSVREIDKLFLTHSHPDHIGGAAEIKRLSGCTVYASAAERDWIEDIDRQFRDRPIPNFYSLLNESVAIDVFLQDGDVIACGDGISLKAMDTPGHSHGSQCFLLPEEKVLFTGDAIPVPGDIPIYVSPGQCEASLQKLLSLDGVGFYCSAWDETRDAGSGRQAILQALEKQVVLDKAVRQVLQSHHDAPLDLQFREVCRILCLERLEQVPPFRQSITAHLNERKSSL